MKVVVTYTVATYGEHAFGDASLVRREAIGLLSEWCDTNQCVLYLSHRPKGEPCDVCGGRG
jgi:hypothetical protein